MAKADGYLRIDTKLNNDEFKKGLEKLKSTGVKAAAAAGAAIGAALYQGMNFESAMSEVAAISGATGESLDALTEKAKEMGAKTVFSATQSAEAFKYMAMAGWKTEDMLSGIEGIMNLAAASGEDLGLVSDIVTDALTAFGLTAQDSTHFADVLAAASSNANTNVSMMGETFKYVAPVAGALGYTIEDTAQAIGLMANAGIKSSQAGTSLRQMFSRLSKPTKEVQSAMSELGISMTDSSGKIKPLNALMQDFRQSFGKLTDAQKPTYAAMIAGQEAMSGLLAIVNASDSDFEKLSGAIANADGTAQDMADTMQDNLKGNLTILASAAEGLAISFYEGINEPLKNAVKEGTKSIDTLNNSLKSGSLKGAIEGIGNLLGEIVSTVINITNAVLPPLISMLGFVGKNIDWLLPTTLALLGAIKGYTIIATITKLISANNAILSEYAARVLGCAAAGVVYTGQLTTQQILIGALTGKISVLTAAQMALNAAWKASHVGVVIAGLTILAGIFYGVWKATHRQTEEEKALAQAQKENAEAIKNRAEAYENSKKQRDENTASSLAEIENAKRLYDQLQDITDENGRVDSANRARAQFIVGELNDALGLEISMKDNIIQGYKDIQAEIYKTIEAKKYEILMQAQEEQYAEAVKNKAKAEKESSEAYANAAPALAQLKQQYKILTDARNELAEAEKNGDVAAINSLKTRVNQAKMGYDAIYNANKDVIDTYQTAKDTYINYGKDIAEYTTAATIAQEDGAEAATKYIEQQKTGYIDLETAQKKHGENTERILGEMGDNYMNALNTYESALELYNKTGSESAKQMVIDSLKQLGQAAEEFKAAGGDLSDTFIKGANGKEVDLTPLLNSIKKNETSFNTEAEKQGLNYSLGVAKGILSGSPDVNAAVKSVINSAIKTGQKTQDSHSPAKVPNKKLGKPFSQGVAKGILSEKKTVDKASRNIITTAVDAARDEAGIHSSSRLTYNDVGVPLVDGIAVAISDNGYKVSDAVEAMFDDLDLKKEVGAYTEEQYYADMEKLRDKYIKKGTKQWWDYTKKIISFEEKQAEEEQKKQAEQFKDNLSSEVDALDRSYSIREKLGIANADDEADIQKKKGQAYAKYCEDVKNATFSTEKEKLKLIKEYAEKSQDCFIDAYTVIADSAKDKFSELSDTLDSTLNDIESKEKAFSDRLKDHAPALTLATFSGGDEGDETFYTLTDWSKKTDEIMAYNNLLDTVLSRSNSKDFNSYILGLGIEDAQKAAHLLNQLSDSDFADYVKKYEEYYKNSENLAFNRYVPEKEEAYNTYETGFEKITEETKDKLKDAFGDVPDDFFDIGLDSGEEFENGFLSVFETVADKVKSTFTKLVSEFKIKADGALGSIKNISYTSTYNLAPSSTDVTTQLRTIRDNEKLNEMRGGY